MDKQILSGHPRARHIQADVQAYAQEAVGSVTGQARRYLVTELVTRWPGLVSVAALDDQLTRLERAA
jgi:hypothetical protein